MPETMQGTVCSDCGRPVLMRTDGDTAGEALERHLQGGSCTPPSTQD